MSISAAADPALLAGRRRAADHLGPGDHQRAAQDAAEPGHLPPAGARPQQGHHALAGASRRRAGLSRSSASPIRAQPYPVAVALGADPATILGAVTPVPDTLSEYQFAGLLRGARTELVKADRQRPARAGHAPRSCWKAISIRTRTIRAATSMRSKDRSATIPATTTSRTASRCSPIDRITMRRDPIYHSTYTGKPPDEPAVLGMALNEVFIPLLQKQFHARSPISICRRKAAATAWRWCR